MPLDSPKTKITHSTAIHNIGGSSGISKIRRRDPQLLEKGKERQERELVRGLRIEILLSSGMILKQEREGQLVKCFSSGTIPERIGKILVAISF